MWLPKYSSKKSMSDIIRECKVFKFCKHLNDLCEEPLPFGATSGGGNKREVKAMKVNSHHQESLQSCGVTCAAYVAPLVMPLHYRNLPLQEN